VDYSPIEFIVSSQNEDYMDLTNSFLSITMQIVKSDGTKYTSTDAEKYSPANYLLNTAFSQVDVTLSDTLISQSNNIHAFRAYYDARFCVSGVAKFHWMKAAGYFRDEEKTPDKPHKTRYLICKESKDFTLTGRIHGDIFQQNKLIINGVPLKLKFIRSSDAFCLMGDSSHSPKLIIKDAVLFIKKVRINPSILSAHAKFLNEANAKYQIVRVDVKAISLAAGETIHNKDNIYIGSLPRKLVMGILENDAHSGSYTKSPFNFKNHNVNFIQVYLNGDPYPGRAYQPDYTQEIFSREFYSLYDNIDQNDGNVHPLDIEFSEFKTNCCFYAFDFSPDRSVGCSSGHISLPKQGNLKVEIHFSTAPTRALKLMVFAEFDSTIEITKNREVITDY